MTKLDASVRELVYHGISREEILHSDKCNLFRSDLFSIFPNLTELELWTSVYRFDPKALLSVLAEGEIPSSFRMLRVKDYDQKWLKRAFDAIPDIQQQFAAEHFVMEYETTKVRSYKVDWINFMKQM